MPPDRAPRAAGGGTAARCAACQLQLCKSRDENPHAQLREDARDASSTVYRCEACGGTLVRSRDPASAGWAVPRRAPVLAPTTARDFALRRDRG